MDLPKAYEPREYEDEIYRRSEASGFFNPKNLPAASRRSRTFSIVMPPPNVTGTLHVGHAVMLAVEDIMIRFARMRGMSALWIPGTDHAAIATQTVVEKKLIKEGVKDPRRTLGREKFLEEVNKFAAASHDRIVTQIKKMGASCDWSREAYTLDELRSRAVRAVFKMMYDDGLIYRGQRVVNWCPRCKSTLADDEVKYREEKTPFYYFKFGPVVIGTARPETKFLDKTIVVHPEDERYKDIVGKKFEVEWIEGKIAAHVIADPVMDKDFGSGAMTMTPGHSHEDFDLAVKHGLEIHKIIDEDGKLTEAAGSFAGRDAREARKDIVAILKKKGLVEKIDKDYAHRLSVCYRCEAPIEPLPKLQWFVDVGKKVRGRTLKERMQAAVESGEIKIIPERFKKTYFHWVHNLRDWCISRQIWFGHRIPVWYRNDETYVGESAPSGDGWIQDEDTLDTWFSSGLWSFSTLGWPEKTNDLERFHPTTVLETGYDILFFWIARMIMMSTYVLDEVPFNTVYLHGLVRDEQGRKMSKSLGNVIDPLDMTEKYGADATRLAFVLGAAPGNDVKISEQKIAGFRNFTNKLWNIARYILSLSSSSPDGETGRWPAAKTLADLWILGELARITDEVTVHLEKYEFSPAGEKLRDFTWGSFADWYIEISKLQMEGTDLKENTKAILENCLRRLLLLWHPFMPFVTEVIWEKAGQGGLLMTEPWPEARVGGELEAGENFEMLRKIISALRSIRADYGISPKEKISVRISAGGDADWLGDETEIIRRLAKVDKLEIAEKREKPAQAVGAVVGTIALYVPLEGLIDLEKERARLKKELSAANDYAEGIRKKLDSDFSRRAPEELVLSQRSKLSETEERIAKLREQLKSLE